MKHKLFAASLTSVAVVLANQAMAEGPIDGKVYGKINVSYQFNNAENDEMKKWELRSNNSRLGFKGATPLNEQMSVIYQLEYGVDPEGDASDNWTQRNSYIGLRCKNGEILAGKHDTPLKTAQGKFDLFNDLSGDISGVLEGENRASNIIQYSSPTFMDNFSAKLAIIPGEENGTGGNEGENNGPADGVSGSVTYEKDKLYVALALDSAVENQNIARIVASYTIDQVVLSALYQKAEIDDTDLGVYAGGDDESDSFGVSAAFKLNDKVILKAQVVSSDANLDIEEGEQFSVGADYKLGKKTKAFGFYTMLDAKDTNDEVDYVGVGLEHNF